MIKTILATIKSKKGTTLAELLVTFALTAILMTAATFMIISGIRAAVRAHDIHSAISVSSLILDKVTGELTAARLPEKDREGYYIWLDPETPSSWIVFNSKNNIPAAIQAAPAAPGTEEHYLSITYYETGTTPESHWNFEPAIYMNYEIKSLTFSLDDPTPGLIKVDLTLINKITRYQHQSSAYAYPHTYNPETAYISQRNDGHTKIPATAREFAITPSSDDESSNNEPPPKR